MNKIIYRSIFLLAFSGLQAQTKIGSDIIGKIPYEQSGKSVSISADGSTVVIGAHTSSDHAYFAGQGRVFQNISGTWTQIGQELNGEDQDLFGMTTAISSNGKIVAFGAPFDDNVYPDTGEVRVYENVSGNWVQVGSEINGILQEESVGFAVSLSGDGSIMATGAPYNDAYKDQSGQVKVYKNISGVWTKIGFDIEGGENAFDRFGSSVSLSLDGLTVAVGAPQKKSGSVNMGHVKVYKYEGDESAGDWFQVGNTIGGTQINEQLGASVSLSADGTVLAVGSPTNSGAVSVYKYNGTLGSWELIGNKLEGSSFSALELGASVSLSADGSVLCVGAPGSNSQSGRTLVFKNESGNWIKKVDILGSGGEYAGSSVSLSSDGSIVAVGALLNATVGPLGGKTSVYDLRSSLSADEFVMAGVSVYPNPVRTELYIQSIEDLNVEQVNIYSTLGQLIKSERTNKIDMSSFQKGFYLVQIVTDKGEATHKILVD